MSSQLQATIYSDSEINNKVRSLNLKQRQIFNFIFNWAKLQVKVKSGIISNQPKPFHPFFPDSGCCDKSHLIKTIYHVINEVFLYRNGDPGKPRVLLLASTSVAAIDINGNTIHSDMHIPCRGILLPLDVANKTQLRNNNSESALVIIDEISMASAKLFYQIHKRLNEIFSPGQDIPFGEKSIVVGGHLYQLSPVNAKPVFTFNVTETMEESISIDLWHKFKLVELDQVIPQDDDMHVNLHNKIRKGEVGQNVKHTIKSRFTDKNDAHCPVDVLHIFVENAPVSRPNSNQLKQISREFEKIRAKDQLPKEWHF